MRTRAWLITSMVIVAVIVSIAIGLSIIVGRQYASDRLVNPRVTSKIQHRRRVWTGAVVRNLGRFKDKYAYLQAPPIRMPDYSITDTKHRSQWQSVGLNFGIQPMSFYQGDQKFMKIDYGSIDEFKSGSSDERGGPSVKSSRSMSFGYAFPVNLGSSSYICMDELVVDYTITADVIRNGKNIGSESCIWKNVPLSPQSFIVSSQNIGGVKVKPGPRSLLRSKAI